jgi:hypothetical protein
VLIRANNHQLWQLPWNQWDLLERYSFAEIGLSTLEYERPPRVGTASCQNQLRILAILGNSEGIKVEEDRKQLENLSGCSHNLSGGTATPGVKRPALGAILGYSIFRGS